ncbi:MAG: hypothetical protein JO110_05785 [Acetobacteraceae bacterium]|nr:hypothetical protein [Acetobacteraceae bacterium]
MAAVTIAMERENYLLLARGGRFAVAERRNDRIYNLHGGSRDGINSSLADAAQIFDEKDWVDELTARAALNDALAAWMHLSECMR